MENEFKEIIAPLSGEMVFTKRVNSAFIETGLKDHLFKNGLSTLVVTGLTTDHCVSTTARMAANFGFNTYVVSDATVTFNKMNIDGKFFSAQLIHETALAILNKEFATVVRTECICAELKNKLLR